MGGKFTAVFVSMLIVITNAIRVNVTDKWIPEMGWQVICSWEIPLNDSLQSVRLAKNGTQFMIYRPEIHGPLIADTFRNSEIVLAVNCEVSEPGYRKGQCVLRIEPLQPPNDNFVVRCEVSGERPTFKIVEEEHLVKVIVPPSDAAIVSKEQGENSQARVSLNCSSFGLPAPNLLWKFDTDKHAHADFTGRAWNVTSKLWHAWSFFSYTASDHRLPVICTPITEVDGEIYKGSPAQVNSANTPVCSLLFSTAVLMLQLLR